MIKGFALVALIITQVILMPTISKSQGTNKPRSEYQIAVDEANTILDKSDSIRDLRKHVVVRAKAANLLWARDPEEARMIFIKLWEKIEKVSGDESSKKESFRIDLLEQLFPRDRALATRLIESSRISNDKANSVLDKLNGTTPETRRLAFLSYRLAEENAVLAARVLEVGLSENTAPMLPLILNRIRENNPLLANYIAAQALERFPNQSPTTALFGLATVAGYLFPLAPSPAISTDAMESDESLREQFMFVGYDILKRSLSETDESLIRGQGFNDKALTLRKINQALTAGILAALSTRYATEYFVELNILATNLVRTVPPQLVGIISIQIEAVRALIGSVEKSEISDAEIISAIAREDFFGAELLIKNIKDEEKRKSWINILYRAQAKVYLQRGEPLLALSAARKIENTAMAVSILIDISKLANKKKDESLSINAFQEIQNVIGKLKDGMQAKTRFSISSEIAYSMKTQSYLLLQTSVETINALSEIKSDKVSYTGENYWSDPDNFLNSAPMMKAFAIHGEIDMQETLLLAYKFRDNSLQMIARLATIERVLRKGPPKAEIKKVEKKETKN